MIRPTPLDAAIKIGEQAVDWAIVLTNRERRLKWQLYRTRHLIKTGRTADALKIVEQALEAIKDGVSEMVMGTQMIKWVHDLHQVTGSLALGETKPNDLERMIEVLERVAVEMRRHNKSEA